MQDKPKVAGMIMTYNCAELLEKSFSNIPRELFDILYITDDGSKDDIKGVAERLGIPLYVQPHGGYGGNLKRGLRQGVELGADIIVEIHGDGQFASSIEEALGLMRGGCDMVLGNRFYKLFQPLKDGMSLIRFFGNYLLSLMGRGILRIDSPDLFTGFRVYSRRLVERLNFEGTSDDYFFSFEIIVLTRYAGLKISPVPTRCYYNNDHTSMKLWKGFLEIGQTPWTLFLYLLARTGLRTGMFARQAKR